jgi:AraC family transcriptional regulator, transcriptional activator of pobA
MKTIPIRRIDSDQPETPLVGRFKIRALRDVQAGNDLVQPLHKHDFFFVLLIEKGRGSHEIDFVKFNVHNHSIFILRPGQVHQLELKAGCSGYLMEFDTAFYHPSDKASLQRLTKASNKNSCTVKVKRFHKLLSVLSDIFDEYTAKQEGYTEVIKASLDIFFIQFIRQSQNPASPLKKRNSYTQERYETFLEILSNRITELKQVSQYAALLNLSVYQLNAITKIAVEKSASELINEQIMLEAKRYLLATSNQVKDIAHHLGYEDFSYFIRFFKKHTGYSPEAFRLNFR